MNTDTIEMAATAVGQRLEAAVERDETPAPEIVNPPRRPQNFQQIEDLKRQLKSKTELADLTQKFFDVAIAQTEKANAQLLDERTKVVDLQHQVSTLLPKLKAAQEHGLARVAFSIGSGLFIGLVAGAVIW